MPRFLLIGLDGAEPSLVSRWMDEGRLPNLARLRATGAFCPLASTVPPATFPAWTTCVTGVNPGRHGIFDFTEMVPGKHAMRYVNATFRKAPALWNILSDAEKHCVVLGVPATYPPEPVRGVMVSGFDSPVATSIDPSFVYPRERYPEVAGWRFADFQETRIGPGWHARALPALLAKLADKERIALGLMRREPWDFFMLVFSETDTVSHHFWLFHDPGSPRHAPGPAHAIRDVYERVDAAVGALVAEAGEDCVIAIVSDHGFGGAGTHAVHLNNWLAAQGLLAFDGGRGGGMLKRLALRCVPERWHGALFRKLRPLAMRAESASRCGGIDWAHTLAWSEELNYFPSIRIAPTVAPEDHDAFVTDLCAKLETWDAVAHAWPRAALYDGPYLDRAPDIILDLALDNGYSRTCLRRRGGPAESDIPPGDWLGAKDRGMNGTHRPEGIFFFSKRSQTEHPRIMDIAPTVLAELGVSGPPMDGISLSAATLDGGGNTFPQPEKPYSAEEEAILEQRLRDLGYLE